MEIECCTFRVEPAPGGRVKLLIDPEGATVVNAEPEKLWKVKDVAAFLGKHTATVLAYTKRRRYPIPHMVVGKRCVFNRREVMDWAASRHSRARTVL